ARARLAVAVAAAALGAALFGVVAAFGAATVYRAAVGTGAAVATAVGWIEVGRRYALRLVGRAGEAARVVDVRSTAIDAEVDAAREAERRTATELADLRSASSVAVRRSRSEEHTSELQSPDHLVCRLLLEKKK